MNKTTLDNINIFIRSILAGICIGLGGAIFLKLGGVIGAVMFAFGLLTVVHFKLPLYTGTAGFIMLNKSKEYTKMLIILLGNILGCFLLTLLAIQGIDGSAVIMSRINAGYLQCFLSAIGCGLIMTLIVQGGRDKNQLLILFGIPLFILLGFYHSIADAFYFFASDMNLSYFPYYLLIVLGNFVGCNVPRLLKY
jgi:formate/nitrite transporter FocA (FNT family)